MGSMKSNTMKIVKKPNFFSQNFSAHMNGILLNNRKIKQALEIYKLKISKFKIHYEWEKTQTKIYIKYLRIIKIWHKHKTILEMTVLPK